MAIRQLHGVFMRSQALISKVVTQNIINTPKTTQILLTRLLIFSQLKSSCFGPTTSKGSMYTLKGWFLRKYYWS